MGFLTPMAGVLAVLLTVPPLLLLYFLKLRRREMVVPSTLLWRRAVQDLQVNAPFQRLRRNLLLLLQLLAVLALAVALSRPTVSGVVASGERVVVLIDRSASMSATDGAGGRSRLDEAKSRAKALIDGLPRASRAMVIAFDDRAEIVHPFSGDTAALKRAVDGIAPGDRLTRLRLAYQLADAQGAMRAGVVQDAETIEPPEVYVFSDGRAADTAELSLRGRVRFVRLGEDTSGNIAVVALSARRNFERPSEVQVFTRLANFGPEPVGADVQLTVNGRLTRVGRVTLPPQRWSPEQRRAAEAAGTAFRDALEFVVDLPDAAVLTVEQMNRQGDVLAADDAASVVVPPPRQLSVAFVTDGNNPYLLRLVEALPLRSPRVLTPAEYERLAETGGGSGDAVDVFVFDGHRPRRLPAAGHFIYFGTLPAGLRLTAETREGALVVDPSVFTVLDWKRDHPVFRGLSLGAVVGQEAIRLIPAAESEVLAEGTRGPLVVLHREGRSIHLAVAINPMQSNWPLRVSYPVFVLNALQFMATASDLSVRPTYRPGDAPVLPRAAVSAALGGGTRLRLVPEPGADGRTGGVAGRVGGPVLEVEVADGAGPGADGGGGSELTLPTLEHVGVYRTEPPVAGFERLAVNLLDANESDVLPAEAAPGGIGETVVQRAGGTLAGVRTEVWWWLVAAVAVPVLLLEWLVFTRRTHA
ncbi:MAG: vWA domain-containing protein [Tepidisphaerales bacterium]